MAVSTGRCPEGTELSESECRDLNGQTIDGISIIFQDAVSYSDPETCGCYLDQSGKVFFNTRQGTCTPDSGEKMICKNCSGNVIFTSKSS